jgi:hypothetical protein
MALGERPKDLLWLAMTRRAPDADRGFDKAPFGAEYRTMEIHQLR